ncbi:AHH domain-containing protein [Pyxidicoccus fallax]|uniref:Lipoprotein n=1 Tax=Pyxidicoccus fallax TaxID=394095 RepID=A0A848LNZ1_9BACT|nr:AHH domain-containing protein [Pyxidicoccus fallax]NMO19568.1 hypothetical protein [Pyxidicoccus fallax]NPC81809.1 AHH domain-containing protein [Pyxidicoccus fallax]
MRVFCITILLLTAGCATTRVVHLDTGQGPPIVYTPPESEPVEVDEAEFKDAITRLVLDMRLDVAFQETGQDARRTLLASTGAVIDGSGERTVPPTYERICQRQSDPDECLSLLAGGFTPGPMERRMMALYFAFDTVWDGVEDAIRDLMSPAALRAMVVSMLGTALVMLVAPEPVTKLLALTLTAALIAYLGTGPVWQLGRGFLRLMDEARDARNFSELEQAGHRFGSVLGSNGARVLLIVALTALGGKNALATQGPKMPGFAQAAVRAQTEGGFLLPAALAGEVQAISIPSAGVLNITLAPTAVAAVAMGPGSTAGPDPAGAIPGDAEGETHHICTNKNPVSDKTGGPWTPLFEKLFQRAELSLEHVANKVRIKGHEGPHPREYHEQILKRLTDAMRGCRGPAQCRAALVGELHKIARILSTPGSELRTLVTKGGD